MPTRAAPGGGTVAPRRANPVPPITYPESLPVSTRREEIARAIREHPVVIVCGETGSGKTTQLPKIALELGRGLGAGGQGLIGHTQPRRIAASSVARRIAEELASPLGEVVGYKVRFQDRLQPGSSVKLMTDGILLAETQGDPLLRAYDTLIIDEAHERSLNIDFLLGYLRRILPQRPDLKVIVTSATIDAERFAQHFATAQGPAPVIMVSGRLYPVEHRWRPFEERRDYGLEDAIADAVDELWRGPAGGGDILVFLPGEREIRDAADHLRRHLAQLHRGGVPAEILPLFARLSQAEQDRVFAPGQGRRIVLATNVAETSLTVPGIRYVIDTGLARVKRYSYRSKVEQLLVEPISQAAARQRAGRCGRVADGVCIRLYDEADISGRPRFTDPEILRSSLAGVILRMKALRLGRVEDFPFLEPPPRKAIADGYALLAELGAVDESSELTPTGAELAKLPLDPRVGRMILEARARQSLAEVLVIASALSVQDVRDRPLEQQQAADERHKPFDDERSEFMGTLRLWKWIEAGRGVHGHAPAGSGQAPGADGAGAIDQPRLSNRQQEQRLREQFISPRRAREWREVHAQLHTVVAEHGWRLNAAPATYEQVHLALLAGLLGNVGCKTDDDEWYLGARGIRFWRHPGANLSRKPGRWIVAAELVETTRLFGRGIAAIEPQWIPPLAGHLLKLQRLEPRWEKRAAEVVALERATLYGIVVYNDRRVNYGQVDPAGAREIFIREALVGSLHEDTWDAKHPFLSHNRKTVAQVQEIEHKARRQDVLVDDDLIAAFYDAQLPAEVCSGASFDRWFREAVKTQPRLLQLTREELMRHEAAGITTDAYPRTIRLGGIDCAASYLHEPGDPKDGLTVTLPIYALNQVSGERCEWLVPGMLLAKVLALLKSLHQRPRSRLVPLPESAAAFCADIPFAEGSLPDALVKAARERTQLPLQRADFKPEQLPPHLFMNFRVVDEHGRQLGMGRDLAALKSQLGGHARSAFQALAALERLVPMSAAPAAPAKPAMPAAAAPGAAAAPAVAAVTGPGGVGRPTETGRDMATRAAGGVRAPIVAPAPPVSEAGSPCYTDWSFGELPELMEVRRGSQVLVGFPALVDRGQAVGIEVFDEPGVAARQHRAGLRRLLALQLREPIKYMEKNIPGLQAMAGIYLPLGTLEDLRTQIVELALDRAFLGEPLPTDAATFRARLEHGRARLNLIAQEVARQAATVLGEYAAALRKLKDSKPPRDLAEDVQAQLQRLVGPRFLLATPWPALQHLPRYLKAIVLRLEKWRSDPARDAQRLAELRPLEQRWQRRLAALKGAPHARLDEYRWLLEELRVSLFAQELRTPQPVSAKRLDKVWAQIEG